MKAIVILNPHAHSGRPQNEIEAMQSDATAQLTSALSLDSLEWRETEHPGHGKELAEEGIKRGFDYIFAGGGDGTINEVLNGIMGAKLDADKRPIFGVLPFGTSNDFFAALKEAEASRKPSERNNLTFPLDVGHVQFDNVQFGSVERYFCLTVGIGLFSWANEQYLDKARIFGRRFAHLPAAISTILGYRFLPDVKVSRNGKQSRGRRILWLVVDNSPVIAGGTALTPKAKINDGQFDVSVLRPLSWLGLLWVLIQIGRKTHANSRFVDMGRAQEITVIAKEPLPVHVDGELVPEIESKAKRMEVKIMPGALCIVIPSICEINPKPVVAAVAPA